MNRILKSSCIISLTAALLFPGVAVSLATLEVSVTGCMAEGNCIGPEPNQLSFTLEHSDRLVFFYRGGNDTMTKKNVTVSVFQLPDRNDSFHFQYRISSPQICHAFNPGTEALRYTAPNVFNPWLICSVEDKEANLGEVTFKKVNFHTRVNNLKCVRDADNNEYSLTWNSVGCVSDVIVTLVSDSGEIVQMHTENNGAYMVTPGLDNLRLAYVAPVISADGSGDDQTECRYAVIPDFQKPVRPTIYSVLHMNQTMNNNATEPLGPDQTYSLMFDAPFQAFISIATMKVHSNDLFLAFSDTGLPLFDEMTGLPLYNQTTDVSSELYLWDAGTEVNEKAGLGNRQPLKSKANSPDGQRWVRLHDRRFDNTPNVTDLASANIQYLGSTNDSYHFIFNLINEGARFAPNPGCEEVEELFSPGLCVVHSEGNALFTAGQADYGDGLKALAEGGNTTPLYIKLEKIRTDNSKAITPTAITPTAITPTAFTPTALTPTVITSTAISPTAITSTTTSSAAISAISNLLLALTHFAVYFMTELTLPVP